MKKTILSLTVVVISMFLCSCGEKSSMNPSNSQIETQTLTAEEKIFGLSLIWKEAQYNFPFWVNLKDLDWDAAYHEALTNVLKENDIREYYLELSKFITLLRDGHTDISFPESVFKNAGRFPVLFGYLNGKYYIVNFDINMDIDLWSEVVRINQMDANDYFTEKFFPYFWHEKLDSASGKINSFLPIVEYGKELEITTEKQTFKMKATTETINWKLETAFPISKDESFTELFKSNGLMVELTNDNIAVITIPTFSYGDLQNEFYNILPKIKNCKGFIIDVRNNGGGNSGYADSVAQAFIKEKNFENSRHRLMVYIGTYKAWGRGIDFSQRPLDSPWIKKAYDITNRQYFEDSINRAGTFDCPSYLDQPLVVLANQGTVSAAEDFLVVLDNLKRATIVGTASYGSTGQPILYDLPGGGGVRICTRWCLYPDGREFINIGVQPHIYAQLSIEDIKNGYDSVFKKGIDTLREKINK